MLKTSTLAACALALSGSAALAQSYTPWMPQTPTAAPRSAAGTPRSDHATQAMAPGQMNNPQGVAITDEYGNQYNSRGDRIGRGRPVGQPVR